MELFGFSIKRKTDEDDKKNQSFAEKENDDGSLSVVAAGGAISSIIDLEGTARSEAELIQKYRNMIQHPEVQMAVDDIVNEAINSTYNDKAVEVITDDLTLSTGVKKKIEEEFENSLKLLDFSNQGYEIFQRWYVDGRLNYHVMIDETAPKKGIQELRYIDPRKLRKVREYEKSPVSTRGNSGYTKKLKNEYFIYSDRGFNNQANKGNFVNTDYDTDLSILRIAKDAIVHCNSGVLNETNTLVLSHLHKAYKPLNQLRMLEDAVLIYRVSRAPERRIFYIDVGNLPKMKAEQYLRDMMAKHKNRLVYDASTGEIRDDRRHMSMTDDFWLPRREGGKGTEITTLPAGQNLGEMEDVNYFQRRLYKSLNVPISRMEPETGFSLGRASEISRDEVKFSKFVRRLQTRFSILFDKVLEKQLILKGIITPEEWPEIQQNLRYNFKMDNHFEELKTSEILQNRIQLLRDIDEYTGRYYSKEWVQKEILQLTDSDIADMKKQIDKEKEEEPDDDMGDEDGPPQQFGESVEEIVETIKIPVLSDSDRKLLENVNDYIEGTIKDFSLGD